MQNYSFTLEEESLGDELGIKVPSPASGDVGGTNDLKVPALNVCVCACVCVCLCVCVCV
jgi:hypothetical protein